MAPQSRSAGRDAKFAPSREWRTESNQVCESLSNRKLKVRTISTNESLILLDICICVVRFCEFNHEEA